MITRVTLESGVVNVMQISIGADGGGVKYQEVVGTIVL